MAPEHLVPPASHQRLASSIEHYEAQVRRTFQKDHHRYIVDDAVKQIPAVLYRLVQHEQPGAHEQQEREDRRYRNNLVAMKLVEADRPIDNLRTPRKFLPLQA